MHNFHENRPEDSFKVPRALWRFSVKVQNGSWRQVSAEMKQIGFRLIGHCNLNLQLLEGVASVGTSSEDVRMTDREVPSFGIVAYGLAMA